MCVDYRIDTARGLVFTDCHGNISAADMDDIAQRLRNDPAFNPDYRQLVDLTAVSGISAPFDAIRHFASDQRGDPFSGKSHRAIVAPHDLTFGVARMYEALREDKDNGALRVFRSLPEALKWLELDSL